MTARLRVLILGGGIGGLSLAAALGQRGIAADVAEAREASSVLGVGLIQPGNALRALRSLGVLERCLAVGFSFEQWKLHDATGRFFGNVPTDLGSPAVPANNGISRRELHDALLDAAARAGATFFFGTTLAGLHDHGSHVSVTLSSGKSADYDLVVGFDGIRSELRCSLFGERYRTPSYTGHAVFRFMTERPSEVDGGALYFGRASKVGLVPLSATRMYLFAVTRAPGNPRLSPVTYPSRLRELLAGFGGVVAELRERVRNPDDIVYSPIEEVLLPSPWHRGRVVVCGDAAHASAPHLAQGAAMAIEDAVVLAELISGSDDIPTVLEAFMHRRLSRCRAVQEVSHTLLQAEAGVPVPAASDALHTPQNIERILSQPA
jgi:2-polyprenyl-6-methoxyphenol hydroxylase-like FAD-dependent oxidoreductase